MIRFGIQVRADLRRKGLGSRLLQEITKTARESKRALLMTNTFSFIQAGESFMRRLGAQRGVLYQIIQLALAEVDRTQIKIWQTRAAERASGFDLVCWDNRLPEDQLQAFCDLMAVMATAPRDNLLVENRVTTPNKLREYECVRADLGIDSWMMAARERASGKLAGYTQLLYNPLEPHLLRQVDTGVWPQYRRLGLGRWLKAAMLERVLIERPEVQFIRTGNASSNAPMLKINHELGFRPYCEQGVWQLSLERAEAYLNGCREGGSP